MSVELLLTKLAYVRQRGPHRWVARCPAHDDRVPSLSIREEPDGRVLAHCFAGCAIEDVLATLDLQFSDLFPPNPTCRMPPVERPWRAGDLIRSLEIELSVALVTLASVEHGDPVDRNRVREARARIVRFLGELRDAS